MDIEFHYFITYVIALRAVFSAEDSHGSDVPNINLVGDIIKCNGNVA